MMVNRDNICIKNGYSSLNNLDISNGCMLVKSHFLVSMFSLEDVTSNFSSLHGLQQLDSPLTNYEMVLTSLTFKQTRFTEELKLFSKWTYILDEEKDSNIKKNDKSD